MKLTDSSNDLHCIVLGKEVRTCDETMSYSFIIAGLQITAGQRTMSSKNRFCPVKSLDDRTICPVVYAGKEKIESFKF